MKKIAVLLSAILLLTGCHDAKETVESQIANDASTVDSLDELVIFKQLVENYK